jgi:uncharacterized protein YjbI with pentapeptide repeats
MKIVRPLQLSFQHKVIEHNNRFYATISSTLGINLLSNETLLEHDWKKSIYENPDDVPLPDMGMAKPNGEYLISGSYYSPQKKEVTGGEVRVKLSSQEKNLFVFGPRIWKMGVPSHPGTINTMQIKYALAFGGNGLETNPDGMGYEDTNLPFIEKPDQLISNPNMKAEPAGFSALNSLCSQRKQYQGTYDDNYLQQFFPGYPADFDWRYSNCAPQDQWHSEYYRGNESFEIHNMHPDKPLLSGHLPGFYARCFIKHTIKTEQPVFAELPLNLDTVWFYPDKELVILTWRGTIEVDDDEAAQISQMLLAYEDFAHEPRSMEHYAAAQEKRIGSDDSFLNNFNTPDLIPPNVKTAMELLFAQALSGDNEESEFAKNLKAKSQSTQELVKEKIDESMKQYDGQKPVNKNIPDDAMPDFKAILEKPANTKPDPDIELFNKKIEKILPGITAGDPKKIDFKHFAFSQIDEIMAEVHKLTDKKQAQALEEINKSNKQMEQQMLESMKDVPDDQKKEIEQSIAQMKAVGDQDKVIEAPLPRMKIDEIMAAMNQLEPDLASAMQQVNSLKSAGVENEHMRNMETMINEQLSGQQQQMEESLRKAEVDFKQLYMMGAHFQGNGLSPHKADSESVTETFLEKVKNNKSVASGDWACIDLSLQKLDGIDLSGAFLEQVNFQGASLVGANLSGAILARANLDGANFSGANFEGANIGAVHAHNSNFTDANMESAKLSKADFSGANFTRARLVDIESLEMKVAGANFTEADMPGLNFIEVTLNNVCFHRANLGSSTFLKCAVSNCDFAGAIMPSCTWADVKLDHCHFDSADMTSNCFAATEPQLSGIQNCSFKGTRVDRCNFQGMNMPASDFENAIAESTIFSNADLSGSNFSNTQAQQAQFRGTKLTNARLDNINLKEGSLAKAHLVSASFVGANLYAVDMLRSTMGETDFRGAYLESTLIKDWRPS